MRPPYARGKKAPNVDDDMDYDDGTVAVDNSDYSSSSEGEDHGFDQSLQVPSKLRVQNAEFEEDDEMYGGKPVPRKMLDKEDEEEDEEDEGIQWPSSDEDEEDRIEYEDREENDDTEDDEEDGGMDTATLLRGLENEEQRLFSKKDSSAKLEKAEQLAKQQALWEGMVELQIFIKRFVTNLHALPPDQLSEAEELMNQVRSSLKDLYTMQQRLVCFDDDENKDGAVDIDRVEDELEDAEQHWDCLSSRYEAIIPYCGRILQKWTSKVSHQAGHQFKLVDQNIVSQVDGVVADPDRLKRKAHPQRDDETYDDEIYDDADFYQQMLKEFIDQGNSGASGLEKEYMQRRLKKRKRNVDTKASKGRKLRYKVHEKLQHFMFPTPDPAHGMDLDELYGSLFGKRREAVAALS